MEDRRLYTRFDLDCPAKCAFLDSFPESFPVAVKNIGPEGIGFISDERLDIGTSIFFLIDLDKGESVKFITKVRWCQPIANSTQFNVGVKIYDSSDKDLERFIRFYCQRTTPFDDRKKKILVIDHDRESAKLLQKALAKSGHDALCAYDGEDGFSAYLSQKPNLIILDRSLPKLNGHEICRKIRRLQNDHETAIIMLVAKKKDIAVIEDADIGVQKFFIKPFQMDRMLSEVNRILALPKE